MSDDRKSKAEIDIQLSESEQDTFYAFAEKHTLLEAVRWLQDHKFFTLSEQAISKWLARRRKEAGEVKFRSYLAGIKEDNERAMQLGAEVGSAANLNDANVLMLSQALFEARRTGDLFAMKSAAKLFSMVLESVAKSKAAEASVITAQTSRDKFQFDAAKSALAEASTLQRINESAGSERQKVERAIETLFGRRPEHLTSSNSGGGEDVDNRSSAGTTSELQEEINPVENKV